MLVPKGPRPVYECVSRFFFSPLLHTAPLVGANSSDAARVPPLAIYSKNVAPGRCRTLRRTVLSNLTRAKRAWLPTIDTAHLPGTTGIRCRGWCECGSYLRRVSRRAWPVRREGGRSTIFV